MTTCRCTFRARDFGRSATLDVPLTWSIPYLREQVEDVLGIRVHTMKFQRRPIVDTDSLDELGLGVEATIFVNSPTLAMSLPPAPARMLNPVAARAREYPSARRSAPVRACGFSPAQVEQRVASLEAMGFDRALCEQALRAACYNLDRAADYLITGCVPEPLELIQGNLQGDSSLPGELLDGISGSRAILA